ncbi:dTDP-4-keto-6-deoxy-D-glucose epimerase [Candidatus Roizmanbacteria bacterium]|nr:dTDP-4-keto-6-deoxy-D-glucose epimerase [Candidatus Roizmanbacteria bacterium]
MSTTLFQPISENKITEHIYKTGIPGLFFLENKVCDDERGFFREVGHTPELNAVLDFEFEIKQINHARSYKKVVRGMHAEYWNKLITVTQGTIYSAFVDIRPDSETFGKVEYIQLGENGLKGAIFISKGIANSVCVVDDPVDYLYFVDALYKDRDVTKDKEFSLFDPDVKIEWPVPKEQMVISERDQNAPSLRTLFPDRFGR